MAGKKLLVADDSLTIQKVIRLALSNEGYEIQAVSDGNDAIQQISLFRPDAVLIDVSLPGKTAFEVKRAINEHIDLEEVRFILMSSAFEKVDEPQADEVKFHGRLTKPFDPAHLRQILSETLAQVAAKRQEPTSLLQRPTAEVPLVAPPQPPTTSQTPLNAPPLPPVEASLIDTLNLTPPAPPAPASMAPTPQAGPSFSGQIPGLPPIPTEFDPLLEPEVELDFSVSPPNSSPHSPPYPNDELPISEEWLTPVQPNELIINPPPPAEEMNQLWDQEPTLSTDVTARFLQEKKEQQQHQSVQTQKPAPTSPPPAHAASRTPPPPSAPASLDPAPHGTERDADIRHLTESTIRMSGLDDFEWSVSEPSLKPSSQMLDIGETSFQIESSADTTSSIPPFKPEFVPEISNVTEASSVPEVESPSLVGLSMPGNQVQSAAAPSDFYRDPSDITKRLARPLPFNPPPVAPYSHAPESAQDAGPAPANPMSPFSQAKSPAGPPAPPGSATRADVVGISSEQIEELLRKELQKLLPDLAEKLIKQEIHKMLSATDGAANSAP